MKFKNKQGWLELKAEPRAVCEDVVDFEMQTDDTRLRLAKTRREQVGAHHSRGRFVLEQGCDLARACQIMPLRETSRICEIIQARAVVLHDPHTRIIFNIHEHLVGGLVYE